MPLTPTQQLAVLSDFLATRREAILVAWQKVDRPIPNR